ncbi:uncharacterized protein TNCV_2232701 [Trichonephila clavipes]|nr:uncharacterized protein TNCV_2232701 [Trichonephila clavipes]
MNFPPPTTKFQRYNGIFLESLSKVSDASMKKAVEESVEMNNINRDITALFDGSWQKRGHTSLNGVVSATFLETDKILDFECLSKYYFVCKNKINKVHKPEKNLKVSVEEWNQLEFLKNFNSPKFHAICHICQLSG